MGQWIWRHHRATHVRYVFRNRTFEVPLAECIDLDELRRRIAVIQETAFEDVELAWLAELGFDPAYVAWLRDGHRLPSVDVGRDAGHLVVAYEGAWADGVFWETHLLGLVSELYYERFHAEPTEGLRRLEAKVAYLQAHPELRFMEFGTRRRFSREWQERVVRRLAEALGDQVAGTSNVHLARTLGLRPLGTMAHQLFMVVHALDGDVLASQARVCDLWQHEYGMSHPEWMTLLPDTYGTAVCVEHALTRAQLEMWPTMRQDSGDPLRTGEVIVEAWRRAGLDPASRTIVFSDGLDLRTMSLIHDHFADKTNALFGWGTNLTNDLGFESLSIVIKPDRADGRPCVKLSDNRAKATGDPAAIAAVIAELAARNLPVPTGSATTRY
jgi:nicotinate phosphoribosyltransferase